MLLKQIDPDVLALLSALIAIDLAKGMDIQEQNVFGNFLIDVGSIIVTIAAAGEARKVALEEAKAKEKEEKAKEEKGQGGGGPAKKETNKAQPAEAETDDILVGREDYAHLQREQESLRRRLGELERRVAAQAGPGK